MAININTLKNYRNFVEQSKYVMECARDIYPKLNGLLINVTKPLESQSLKTV